MFLFFMGVPQKVIDSTICYPDLTPVFPGASKNDDG
jgi:hypothetical protein